VPPGRHMSVDWGHRTLSGDGGCGLGMTRILSVLRQRWPLGGAKKCTRVARSRDVLYERTFRSLKTAGVNSIAAELKLSCSKSRLIRHCMGSLRRPFSRVSSVRVRAQLAFGPAATRSYQDGASGAPIRRRQVPNTPSLELLTQSRRASSLPVSIFPQLARCWTPNMISAS
jgi:hypothetical protein